MESEEPDYVICINCESPCYTFVWVNGSVRSIMCEVCGEDDPDEFVTEEEFEGMMTK